MIPRQCSGHLYDVLDLPHDCTTDDVKRQYRRLALRLHPDRTGGVTTEAFQQVESAHRVLSDAEQRRLYDAFGGEAMKKMGDLDVPNMLRSVSVLQGVLVAVGLLFALPLLALTLIAVKLDSPKPLWSWAAVMVPLWLTAPLFVLIGLACLAAGLKGRALYPCLVGFEVLMVALVIPAVACAALQGRLTPPSRAFIPVVLCYASYAARSFYALVPSVYAAQKRAEAEAARNMRRRGDDSDDGTTQSGNGNGSGDGVDSDNTSSSSGGSNANRSPCRSRRYWRALFQQMLQLMAAVAFFSLCFARAAQGPVGGASSNKNDGDDGTGTSQPLSFWVVFSPLIIYHGVSLLLDFAAAFRGIDSIKTHITINTGSGGSGGGGGGSEPTGSSREGPVIVSVEDETSTTTTTSGAHHNYNTASQNSTATANSNSTVGGGRPEDDRRRNSSNSGSSGKPRASLCARIASGFTAAAYQGCLLYMACMWAAREEVDYNHAPVSSVPFYPSIYAAAFPLFLLLAVPLLLLCCLTCLLSRLLAGASTAAAGATAADSHATTASGDGEGGRTSPSTASSGGGGSDAAAAAAARRYDSTGARREDTLAARANLDLNGPSSKPGAAEDID